MQLQNKMVQERLVRTNDVGFMTSDFFTEVKNALTVFPDAANIHFLINANAANIKVDLPVRERWPRYEFRYTISVADVRELVKDIDLLTATILTKLCTAFRPNLILQ